MTNRVTLAVFCLLLSIIAVSAQEKRHYEIGINASYGISLAYRSSNHFGVDLYGGYKPTDHITVGAGINYGFFQSRLLPSGIEAVFVQSDNHHSFRPYLYGKYDFAPSKKWSPYVSAKVGYGAFQNTEFSFHLLAGYDFGSTVNPDDYAYLKNLDHSLNISGSVYSSLDFGVSRKIGGKGSQVSLGLSLEIQPVTFHYLDKTESRTNVSIGPSIGFSF